MGASHALEAVALSKRFGRDHTVFADLAFVLEPGTVTTLAGGNGSGKSTLLRIVAGTSLPSSGRIIGREARLGVVPERFVPPGNLTAAGYLGHLARIGAGSWRAGRGTELLDRLGLEPGVNVPLRLLSKGNAQKVAIAQAFAGPASLLVLDEPRAGLDTRANGVLDELIEEARMDGSIVLLSGHEDRQPTVVDTSFLLAGGVLSTTEPAAQRVVQRIIRLSPTALSRPLEGLPPGVHAAEARNETVLTVAESQVDAALRVALDNGWSVRGVSDASLESAS